MPDVRLRYQTIEVGDVDIHLCTLRDRQQFDEDDLASADMGISSAQWSLFGVLWPAGELLAELMLDEDIAGKQILEVGCGIGLASLLLNHRGADISAMDYHPEARVFLERNVLLNDGDPIPFLRSDWEHVDPSLGTFDLIIGSDLLYEDEHAASLGHFIGRHISPAGSVVLVDPGRGHRGQFVAALTELGFRQHETQGKPSNVLRFLAPA